MTDMKKWEVELSYEAVAVYVIRAETKEQAKRAALEAADLIDAEPGEWNADRCTEAPRSAQVDYVYEED